MKFYPLYVYAEIGQNTLQIHPEVAFGCDIIKTRARVVLRGGRITGKQEALD
jgi:hypothetical protein